MKNSQKYQVGVIFFTIILICSSVFAVAPQGLIHGQEAIDALGDRLPDVALKNRMSAEQLEELLLRDHDLSVTPDDKLLYTCDFKLDSAAGAEPGSPGSSGSIAPYNQTFLLHSQPGAEKTIYLDFDGQYIVDENWNNGDPVDALPYDTDGDTETFTDHEKDNIQLIWARVAEDYIIFDDFDVTTEDPGIEALKKDDENDDIYGIRMMITETNMGNPAGGGAYYHSFSWATDTVAWCFTTGVGPNPKNVGEVCSHEAGHTLSLYHDGTSGGGPPQEYYSGHDSWAPIMGVSYTKSVTQWDKGEYSNANNTGDDLAIMQTHGFGYRADDCGDTIGTATALGSVPITESYGIIETSTDVDVYSITLSQETDITVKVWSDWPEGNLDLDLQLLESDSTLIEQADNVDIDVESVASTLAAGTYYIRIEGVSGTGYSNYASLGQYYISVLDYFEAPPADVILDEVADLDLTNVVKAINFGDTTNQTIGSTTFNAAAYNTTVDGVTNNAGRLDVYTGEFSQTSPNIGGTSDDNALEEILGTAIYDDPYDIDIAVSNGEYTLQLLLYEGWSQTTPRADFTVEGVLVLDEYDKWAQQGSTTANGSLVTYTFDVTDGNIDITCDATVGADCHFAGLIINSLVAPETDPPTPNPATFSSAPSADSETAISMTATTGTDATDPVEYYFNETTSGPGATDSGWQTSPNYTDSDLTASTQYTYTVQMRDSASTPNVGTVSSPANATTDAACSATDMHIEAVVCAEVNCGGPNRNGRATVTIYDDCGNALSNALVTVTFSGDISETIYDVETNASGVAVLTSSACVRRPSFSVTVDSVTHGTLSHDSNDDLATGCSG